MTFQADVALVVWYGILVQEGELDRVLRPAVRGWDAFSAHFRQVPWVFSAWAGHLISVAWFEPFYDGAAMGFWLAPSCRRTREGMRQAYRAAEWGLAKFPVLLAVVHDPRRKRLYERFGFEFLGVLPRLRDGLDCWLGTMTTASMEKAKARYE